MAIIPPGDRVQAAIVFACLVGLVQLGITVLRLGDLSRYVSHAVIVGFTLGAGILLVLDQFKHLVGLGSRGGPEDPFLEAVLAVADDWRFLARPDGAGRLLGTIVSCSSSACGDSIAGCGSMLGVQLFDPAGICWR